MGLLGFQSQYVRDLISNGYPNSFEKGAENVTKDLYCDCVGGVC
jgi:hypothetical protein